ncbi:MAG: gluconate 2-dehydrogenase gamma chain [Rhodospirillaceae bacterium]|jgi:gluconate 2-dehydrogenase gamma chain|nr:gluconate 2-dehydrogenase gamma chain [Rhodospirillaceae bacterium]
MEAKESDEGPRTGLRRRDLLRRAGAFGALVAVPAGLVAAPAVAAEERGEVRALAATEAGTLNAVLNRLIPSDASGPGATEAQVARYIDRALAGPFSDAAPAYAAGLAALDDYAAAKYGAAFAALPPATQDLVLGDLEAKRATGFVPDSSAFFEMVRMHALQGMFSDPVRGGNAKFAGWDLIGYPGIRMDYSAHDQRLGVKLKPAHHSAADFNIFNPKHGA